VHRRVRFDHDEEEFLGMFANTAATGDGPISDVVGYGDTHDAFYEVDLERRTLEAYGLELRKGIYRGSLAAGEEPTYHRPKRYHPRRVNRVACGAYRHRYELPISIYGPTGLAGSAISTLSRRSRRRSRRSRTAGGPAGADH